MRLFVPGTYAETFVSQKVFQCLQHTVYSKGNSLSFSKTLKLLKKIIQKKGAMVLFLSVNGRD